MNDRLKDLESEMQSFQPASVSPELRDRVARELQSPAVVQTVSPDHRNSRRNLVWWAAAAVILVAVGIVVFQRSGNLEDHRPGPRPPQLAQGNDDPSVNDSAQPTLWGYRLAMADSPQRLDALLDQHASALLPPAENPVHVGFTLQ